MATHEIIEHVMPDTLGGDILWFYRQNPFEQQEIKRQVKYKQMHWPELGSGPFAKLPWHHYPHVLPPGNEKKNFYAPIAEKVFQYMDDEKIAIHTESLNLKSSQAACFNFLFPLRVDLDAALRVLRPFFPHMSQVTGIEFEYTGQDEKNSDFRATEWLGEPKSGRRGQNRTSIDAAVFYQDRDNRACAALIEWKYTEHSYGGCSAYAKANEDARANCQQMNLATGPAENLCVLTSGKQHCQRNYWYLMKTAGISWGTFHAVKGCPFKGPFYQLMRQYMLAAYLRTQLNYYLVDVISVDFAGNMELRKVSPQIKPLLKGKPGDVLDAWNVVLQGVPFMRHIYAEDLARSIEAAGIDTTWREYLLERYGV